MSQQNNTNAKTQDASADVGLFSELQYGVSGAKQFCILSPVSRGLNAVDV